MRGITSNTPKGAALGSPVVKTNDTDKKGVAYSYQMIGGFIPVLDQNDRNSIPVDTKLNEDGYSSGQRELGMVVYYMKSSSLVFYQLRIPTWDTLTNTQKVAALADNNNWVSVSFASSVGGGHTILDETTALDQRSKLAFVGSAVTVTDDAAGDKTVVTINASSITVDSIPTTGSTNAVSSGGVFNALSEKVDVDTYDSFVSATTTSLGNKVDVVTGKGLSTNDYTTAEQTKVANLSGTNTGDETTTTIKSKLGAATNASDGYATAAQIAQIESNTANVETSYAFSPVTPVTTGSGVTNIDANNLLNPSRTITLSTTNTVGTPNQYQLSFSNLKNGAVLRLRIKNTYSTSLFVVMPAASNYIAMGSGGAKTFEVEAGKRLSISIECAEFKDGSGNVLATEYEIYKINE